MHILQHILQKGKKNFNFPGQRANQPCLHGYLALVLKLFSKSKTGVSRQIAVCHARQFMERYFMG